MRENAEVPKSEIRRTWESRSPKRVVGRDLGRSEVEPLRFSRCAHNVLIQVTSLGGVRTGSGRFSGGEWKSRSGVQFNHAPSRLDRKSTREGKGSQECGRLGAALRTRQWVCLSFELVKACVKPAPGDYRITSGILPFLSSLDAPGTGRTGRPAPSRGGAVSNVGGWEGAEALGGAQ